MTLLQLCLCAIELVMEKDPFPVKLMTFQTFQEDHQSELIVLIGHQYSACRQEEKFHKYLLVY